MPDLSALAESAVSYADGIERRFRDPNPPDAFLLHDVFDFSSGHVAKALERNEAACRQLAARVRAHVRAVRPTAPPALSERSASKGRAPC